MFLSFLFNLLIIIYFQNISSILYASYPYISLELFTEHHIQTAEIRIVTVF